MIRNALFLCVVCAIIFVFYLPSYVKMQDMSERNRSFEKRIVDLEKENIRLEEERRRLTEDPVYFEKVAREKMGIIKDGEVIYKIVGSGQKTDGSMSEEASVVIRQPEDDIVKPKGEVKPAVKAAVKTTKPVVKKTVKSSSTSSKASTKKSTKVTTKPKVVATKKSSKTVTTKATTNSTTK